MPQSGGDPIVSKTEPMAINVGIHVLREAREAKGYSIEDLAVTCGLTADEIRKVELGKSTPGYLRRVANALGLPENASFDA